MASQQKTILVLYYTRRVYPLRDTIQKHLYCWKHYSKHRVIYVNVAFGFPEALIRDLQVDVVIFHTIFLSVRWGLPRFRRILEKCRFLKSLTCTKIAIPQDEFLNTEPLNVFIRDFGITHVLTCSEPEDWPKIYPQLDKERTQLKTVLTGYLDAGTLARIEALKQDIPQRTIDIGYRAWKAQYWLGEHGMHKLRLGEVFQAAAQRLGIKADISLEREDVLLGEAWFDYLLRCKATLGVEGGASVLDKDGEIRRAVNAYLQEYPQASFEAAREHCFPGQDHKLGLACLSPRHLEACATQTCQFLMEGGYNGILQPWKHYVPIKKDYSNVEAVLAVLQQPDVMEGIVQAAYADVVQSGQYTYERFVQTIEAEIIDLPPPVAPACPSWRSVFNGKLLNGIDSLLWQAIRLEVQSRRVRGKQ